MQLAISPRADIQNIRNLVIVLCKFFYPISLSRGGRKSDFLETYARDKPIQFAFGLT